MADNGITQYKNNGSGTAISSNDINNVVTGLKNIQYKMQKVDDDWALKLGHKPNKVTNWLMPILPKAMKKWLNAKDEPLALIDQQLRMILTDVSRVNIDINRLILIAQQEKDAILADYNLFLMDPDVSVTELKKYVSNLGKINLTIVEDEAELHSERDDKNREELLVAVDNIVKLKESIVLYLKSFSAVCAEHQQKGIIQQAQLVACKSPIIMLKEATNNMGKLSLCNYDASMLVKETLQHVNDAMVIITHTTKFMESNYIGRAATVEEIKQNTAILNTTYENLFGKGKLQTEKVEVQA